MNSRIELVSVSRTGTVQTGRTGGPDELEAWRLLLGTENLSYRTLSREMHTGQLQIDRIQEKTKALGPGCRAVVWFHGCSRGCPGCIAAEMNRSDEFDICSPQMLADRVCALEGIEGITLSGGEPMDQPPEALAEFLRQIRARTDLSVMVYTGYLLDELKLMSDKSEILGMIDILVDGPYRQELDHGELWRGSSNQTIHMLSDRYASLADGLPMRKGRPVEFDILQSGVLRFTGIPPRGFRGKLEAELNKKQFDIHW